MPDSGERKYGHAEFADGSFGYRHTEDGIHLYSFEGSWKSTIIIPRELDGHPVLGLEEQALGLFCCDKVDRIVIPDSVKHIEQNVFHDCINLKEIIVEGSEGPFYDRDGMLFDGERFLVLCPMGRSGFCALPDGTAGIGDGAFRNCGKLTGVRLPSSVVRVGNAAFENCDGITAFEVDSGSEAFGSPGGVLFSKEQDTLIAYPALKPGDCQLPRNVRLICGKALPQRNRVSAYIVEPGNPIFSSVDGILFDKEGERLIRYPCEGEDEEYRTPDKVRTIEENAFSSNLKLQRVDICDTVQNIGDEAFSGCRELVSVRIGDGVENVGAAAFTFCTRLEKLVIGYGVRHLGRQVFSLCTSLRAIKLPEKIETIGSNAFSMCTKLESISVPDSVTWIGDTAFSWCERLESVAIGGRNAAIGENAFMECTSLVRVSFGAGVVNIGNGPLRHNPGFRNLAADCLWNGHLLTVDVDPANPVYRSEDGVLYDRRTCSLLIYPAGKKESDFEVPTWVREIKPGAFTDCPYLERVKLPEGLKAIGDSAFSGCVRLTAVEVPTGIEEMGENVFEGCKSAVDANQENADMA